MFLNISQNSQEKTSAGFSFWIKLQADIFKNTFFHNFFFSIWVFFHRHWRLTGQEGKRRNHLLFHSTTSSRSQGCCSMRFTTLSNYHLIDWWCDVSFFCLLTWWFDSSVFVTAIWDGKPVDLNPYRLSPLSYKQANWPSVLVTTNFCAFHW